MNPSSVSIAINPTEEESTGNSFAAFIRTVVVRIFFHGAFQWHVFV